LPESALKKNITERKRVRGSVWRKKRKTEEERRENKGEEEREERKNRRERKRGRGRGSVCESVLFLLKHINDTEREGRDHKKTFPY
jgi:hypothetical protein